MELVALEMFPIHQRRMKVFRSEQKGDTKSFLREIVENIKLADWKTFNEEAAACHIFMAFTKNEDAKKACYKILTEIPAGCTKSLMEKIAEIESFPDGKSSFAKTVRTEEGLVYKKVCRVCKRTGHSTAECWGKCKHCSRYGHRYELCRTKIR